MFITSDISNDIYIYMYILYSRGRFSSDNYLSMTDINLFLFKQSFKSSIQTIFI